MCVPGTSKFILQQKNVRRTGALLVWVLPVQVRVANNNTAATFGFPMQQK